VSLLAKYRNLGPFTIDELVDAVNSVLRDRPDLGVSRRTIRFYVSNGVIPPPRGAPKFARYPFENLLKIVAIRRLQDSGERLELAQKRTFSLESMSPEEGIEYVESLGRGSQDARAPAAPSMPPMAASPSMDVRENVAAYHQQPGLHRSNPNVRSREYLELEHEIELSYPTSMPVRDALERAHQRIQEILGTFHDTT
jgi:DNA-binding transcriptional MerR regulator